MSEEKREVLLEVKNLKKYFTVETNFFRETHLHPEGGGRRFL